MVGIKNRIIFLIIPAMALVLIPSAIAPILYSSGNDNGLAGGWSCEGNSSGMNNHGRLTKTLINGRCIL